MSYLLEARKRRFRTRGGGGLGKAWGAGSGSEERDGRRLRALTGIKKERGGRLGVGVKPMRLAPMSSHRIRDMGIDDDG